MEFRAQTLDHKTSIVIARFFLGVKLEKKRGGPACELGDGENR